MPKQKQTTNSAKPSSYIRPLKKEMKMKMNKTNNSVSTQNPIRKEDLFVLGLCLALLTVAVLPLFSLNQVFFLTDVEERNKYESLWVKIPFGILCAVSVTVAVLILLVIYETVMCLTGTNKPGCAGGSSFMMMLPTALTFFLMLPLYIVYRLHIK